MLLKPWKDQVRFSALKDTEIITACPWQSPPLASTLSAPHGDEVEPFPLIDPGGCPAQASVLSIFQKPSCYFSLTVWLIKKKQSKPKSTRLSHLGLCLYCYLLKSGSISIISPKEKNLYIFLCAYFKEYVGSCFCI